MATRTGLARGCADTDGQVMVRSVVVALVFALAAGAAAAPDEPAYLRANARLARTVPHYPRARLLVEEEVGGEVGPVPFEAVQRIESLARPTG